MVLMETVLRHRGWRVSRRSPGTTGPLKRCQWLLWGVLAWQMGQTTDVLAADSQCTATLPDNSLAQKQFAGGIVAFQPLMHSDDHTEIEVVHYHPDEGCLPVIIDSYEINGGSPTLEANFIYPIQGEPNLFTIVSWPLLHIGLEMRGRYYSVYAYHQLGSELTVNTFVIHNPALSSGIVGTIEGEETTFEGTTEEGLIALMGSQGKWSWQATCNPSGKQYELTACAYVENIEAEEELNAIRDLLVKAYTDFPDVRTDVLAHFDEAQQAWQLQLKSDLNSLFPLQPGQDPAILYGSSYAMHYAYTQAFLLRQRAEFLRTFWLPTHVDPEHTIEQ